VQFQLAEGADIRQTDVLSGRVRFSLHITVTARRQQAHPFDKLRPMRDMPGMER
jgi:hypothetical protein